MIGGESCRSPAILVGSIAWLHVLLAPTQPALCVCRFAGGEELFALPLTEYPDLDKTRKVHLLRE